ncbi:hypothetical protein RO3G_11595 [Rhizopus delemar RA 99-880]|uniref:Uncharacterized protein n=1 Tax=Rhizopus delemar (strain RA 99-880 / ATCC MYA-4621 / FGSC 9543 / NRRL 43880) TaxID=246409 RepID=I1CEK4_RHIO9|nr:hypothetical protein RO3G_11595 [Rhizopus delemar RA 99-880]|eukprot:EIE86884.1 hypothetical protein RO3G_11595 [Rhizopus delemar RA 99-880]
MSHLFLFHSGTPCLMSLYDILICLSVHDIRHSPIGAAILFWLVPEGFYVSLSCSIWIASTRFVLKGFLDLQYSKSCLHSLMEITACGLHCSPEKRRLM